MYCQHFLCILVVDTAIAQCCAKLHLYMELIIMNICLHYLYRDAGNYKNWGEVVFTNKTNIELGLLEKSVRKILIDGEFFIAEMADLKKLNFSNYIAELDHDWHEFDSFNVTEEEISDKNKRDIVDFIESLHFATNI
jgi:hypothetical protein